MFGISIDNDPNAPVGTPATRRAVAIHWNWTTDYTTEQIARALGVRPKTVRRYLSEGPSDKVREMMDGVESEVRMVAVAELRYQLKQAGNKSRTAEKPVKIYENENGEVEVVDIELEDGGIKKIPKVQDIRFMPDEEARYYGRQEARQILDQLIDITGAGEPEQVEHTGDVPIFYTEAPDKEQLEQYLNDDGDDD